MVIKEFLFFNNHLYINVFKQIVIKLTFSIHYITNIIIIIIIKEYIIIIIIIIII